MKYTSTVALLAALCLSGGVSADKPNHLVREHRKTRPGNLADNLPKLAPHLKPEDKPTIVKNSASVNANARTIIKDKVEEKRETNKSSRIDNDTPVNALLELEKTGNGVLKRLREIVIKSVQSTSTQDVKDAENVLDTMVKDFVTQLEAAGNCRLKKQVVQDATAKAEAYVKENGLSAVAEAEAKAFLAKIKEQMQKMHKICPQEVKELAAGLLKDLKSGDGPGLQLLTQVVGGNLGERRHARRMLGEAAEIPHPADGSTVELSTEKEEIHFEQDIALAHKGTKVDCFYFEMADGSHTFEICQNIAYEGTIAAVSMSRLGAGSWVWWTKDKAGVESTKHSFTVTIKNPSPQESRRKLMGEILEEEWTSGGTDGGQIQETAGRIYYSAWTIIDDDGNGEFQDYACSGTAMIDNKSGRSLIITAAHCVFDDIAGEFGSNAIFIPNRDAIETALTSKEIHRQCVEDVCGCWSLSAGFVQEEWLSEPWPNRLAYDWGIWVADDWGAHQGTKCGSDALDQAVRPFEFEIGADLYELEVTGFGYSISHNPDFRYCNAPMTDYKDPVENVWTWWLPGCGLSGGASGGPWLMDTDPATGTGKIVSVNSWSISGGPAEDRGMGGPIIDAYTARCLVNAARDADFEEIETWEDGLEGLIVNCYYKECIDADGQLGEVDSYNYYTYDLITYYDMLEGYARRKLRGGGKGGRQLCEEQKN